MLADSARPAQVLSPLSGPRRALARLGGGSRPAREAPWTFLLDAHFASKKYLNTASGTQQMLHKNLVSS